MIALTCPACAAKVKAPDRAAGRVAPCPRCHKPVRVTAARPAPRRPRSPTRVAIILAATGALAAGLATPAVLLYQGHQRAADQQRRDADAAYVRRTDHAIQDCRGVLKVLEPGLVFGRNALKELEALEVMSGRDLSADKAKVQAHLDVWTRVAATQTEAIDCLERIAGDPALCRRFWDHPTPFDRHIHDLMDPRHIRDLLEHGTDQLHYPPQPVR
jgi:hypothetical protein